VRRSTASKARGPWPLLATISLAAAPALGAPPIEALPGTDACVSETGSSGQCVDGKALDGPFAVAVSPDGRNVYVASGTSLAVAVFDRQPSTGALTQRAGTEGCWSEDGSGGACSNGRALHGANGVAVSPDGLNVYVTAFASGEGALAVFDRDLITGALTQKAGAAGCISDLGGGGCTDGTALGGISAVAVSHDGRNVYTTAVAGTSAVAVFDRDLATGVLTQKAGTDGCVSDSGTGGSCTNGLALLGARAIALSLDGRSVYVAAETSNAIAVFDRDPTNGELTQLGGTDACVSEDGTGGLCRDGVALLDPQGVAVSADGVTVYVASSGSDAVAVLGRNRATGALSLKIGNSGCNSETGTGGACRDGVALDEPRGVVVSPDGRSVYVVAEASESVAVFDRTNAAITINGTLVQKAGRAGCISADGTGGLCTAFLFANTVRGVAISPDGLNLYAVSRLGDAVAVFRRYVPAYDIDGDGEKLALTDGLLLLRYLFGFTGDTLTTGAVDTTNCTRCTAPAIEAYIESLLEP
jgi:DNA-binding beta-propeller fold protein YncE